MVERNDGDEALSLLEVLKVETVTATTVTIPMSGLAALARLLEKDPARTRAVLAARLLERAQRAEVDRDALGWELARLEAAAVKEVSRFAGSLAEGGYSVQEVAVHPFLAGSPVQDLAQAAVRAQRLMTSKGVHGRGACPCSEHEGLIAQAAGATTAGATS